MGVPGGVTLGRGGQAGLAPPQGPAAWFRGGLGTPDRARSGVPGLPGRASPGPRLRPARPPQRREAGARGGWGREGREPGSRRLGDWRPAGAQGRARRSRGSGRPGRAAQPGERLGRGERRGRAGRRQLGTPALYFPKKQDVGRPADVMGSPSPAPSPCREGEGRRGGARGPKRGIWGFLSNVEEGESHCET